MFVVSVASCQVEVSVMGLSLVQRSPTEWGVSECYREASRIRRSRPTRGCCAMDRNKKLYNNRNRNVNNTWHSTLFDACLYANSNHMHVNFVFVCTFVCISVCVHCSFPHCMVNREVLRCVV